MEQPENLFGQVTKWEQSPKGWRKAYNAFWVLSAYARPPAPIVQHESINPEGAGDGGSALHTSCQSGL